jgi:hypothetical protein
MAQRGTTSMRKVLVVEADQGVSDAGLNGFGTRSVKYLVFEIIP